MTSILKDFEARQLEIDEDEQLEVVISPARMRHRIHSNFKGHLFLRSNDLAKKDAHLYTN